MRKNLDNLGKSTTCISLFLSLVFLFFFLPLFPPDFNMMLRCTIWSLFAFGSGALPGHSGGKPRGSSPKARQSCDFDSAETPECWGEYDLSTNYYEDGPDTGVVREYWFDIVNGTAAPDGVERIMYTINGSFPGPTIYADWGDTVGKFTWLGTMSTRSIMLTLKGLDSGSRAQFT